MFVLCFCTVKGYEGNNLVSVCGGCSQFKQLVDAAESIMQDGETVGRKFLDYVGLKLDKTYNDAYIKLFAEKYREQKTINIQQTLQMYAISNDTNMKLNMITLETIVLPVILLYHLECSVRPSIIAAIPIATINANLVFNIFTFTFVGFIFILTFLMFRKLNRIYERPGTEMLTS